jgi:hypothetical protein
MSKKSSNQTEPSVEKTNVTNNTGYPGQIQGTIQPFGSRSVLARNQALEGGTRKIYYADEATDFGRAESQADMVPLGA